MSKRRVPTETARGRVATFTHAPWSNWLYADRRGHHRNALVYRLRLASSIRSDHYGVSAGIAPATRLMMRLSRLRDSALSQPMSIADLADLTGTRLHIELMRCAAPSATATNGGDDSLLYYYDIDLPGNA